MSNFQLRVLFAILSAAAVAGILPMSAEAASREECEQIPADNVITKTGFYCDQERTDAVLDIQDSAEPKVILNNITGPKLEIRGVGVRVPNNNSLELVNSSFDSVDLDFTTPASGDSRITFSKDDSFLADDVVLNILSKTNATLLFNPGPKLEMSPKYVCDENDDCAWVRDPCDITCTVGKYLGEDGFSSSGVSRLNVSPKVTIKNGGQLDKIIFELRDSSETSAFLNISIEEGGVLNGLATTTTNIAKYWSITNDGTMDLSPALFAAESISLTNNGSLKSSGNIDIQGSLDLNNYGTILSDGYIIVVPHEGTEGTSTKFSNFGSIQADYIYLRSDSYDISNSGNILLSGNSSFGLMADSGGDVNSFVNSGKIVGGRKYALYLAYDQDSSDALFANFGTIENLLSSPPSDETFSVFFQLTSPRIFGVSPDAQFKNGDRVNESGSAFYRQDCLDGAFDENYDFICSKYSKGISNLERVWLAGDQGDPVGDVDMFSSALSWSDAENLKTWTVEAYDRDVVWEFAGEGAYSTQANTLIDIKQGVARVTTSKGFGEQFNANGSRVNVGAKGTLDLNDIKDVNISDLTLAGGTLQNSGVSEASLETGLTLSADSNIDVPNSEASLTVFGVIDGYGRLTKLGDGVLSLQAPSPQFEGQIYVDDGALDLKGSVLGRELEDYRDGVTPGLSIAAGAEVLASDGKNYVQTLKGDGDLKLEKSASFVIQSSAISSVFDGKISGEGDLILSGSDADLTLTSENALEGKVVVKQPQRKVTPKQIILRGSGTLGSADLLLEGETTELVFDRDDSFEFANPISGKGSVLHRGDGTTILAGSNTYKGSTTIENGVLALSNGQAIPQGSATFVKGTGQLDLVSNSIDRSQFKIDRLDITEGGQVFVSPDRPLVSKSIELDANPAGLVSPGGIATVLNGKSNPPIRSEEFKYRSGSLVVGVPQELQDVDLDNGKAVFEIIDGDVDGAEGLAKNTFIVVEGQRGGGAYVFDGLGEENRVTGLGAVYEGYLEEGSLDLVVQVNDNLECLLDPDSCKEEETDNEKPSKPPLIPPFQPPTCEGDDCLLGNELPDVDGDGLPDVIDPEPEKPCEGDECSVGNELPDTDGDGEPDVSDKDDDNDGIPDDKDPDDDGDGELDQLPGCEVGDDLCDIISDIPGDEDEALEEEEEVAGEVIEAVLDGLEDEEIDLPLSFDYGQLARLIGSGLAPRNVDAAGRGMALHNNVLVDAVFERQPLRQFEELLVSDAVVEESVVEEEAGVVDEAAPVQPLWLKSEELADEEATAYVEGAVAGVEDADVEVADADVNVEAAVAVGVESEAALIELDGVSFVDQQDDELDLAKRDGVSAWVKGYGGNSRADDEGILYNDYDLDAYGTSFGVDVALSESFQIGAFANYGDVNLQHRSGDTGGGSWNPEGWGGGLTAQYSTRNFYVQGLLGASEFSGEQSRNILQINDQFGGNTARGDKTVTSYLGALRLGAPFKTGGVVLEPQAQAVWTHNREHGFSETSGSERNLRLKYKDRTTNFMETELGMKLSVPIRTGERGLLVPSVRAAWLADWNRENEGQEIGYKFTKKTATFDSELDTQNGALIEAGLDYTIQNFNSTSVKVYARGGMELWNSDRGTTWRGSGGVTFQF